MSAARSPWRTAPAPHEGGFRVELTPTGEARFYRPDGRRVEAAPPARVSQGDPVFALIHRLRSQRISIDVPGSIPDWAGGPVDYGQAVETLLSIRDRIRT